MNLASQESNVFWKRISIPKGLPALLEILAKETIRENPDDILPFLSKLVDNLIAKRDQEDGNSDKENTGGKASKRKSEEENPLLKNTEGFSEKYTKLDEEEAASKIQAGFRGYQTRKSLKSNVKKKGGDLSLTSLTPLTEVLEGDGTDEERRRIEKFADEAIAAEIKTPLETIREESIDGRLGTKTPDIHHPNLNHLETETSCLKSSLNLETGACSSTDDGKSIVEAESDVETATTRSKNDNCLTLLANNLSNEMAEDGNESTIVSNVNEVLHAQGSSSVDVDDGPKTEDSNSNGSDEGTSVEIKEPEVETLVDLTDLPDEENISEKIGDLILVEINPEAGPVENTDDDFTALDDTNENASEQINNQVLPDFKSSSVDVDETADDDEGKEDDSPETKIVSNDVIHDSDKAENKTKSNEDGHEESTSLGSEEQTGILETEKNREISKEDEKVDDKLPEEITTVGKSEESLKVSKSLDNLVQNDDKPTDINNDLAAVVSEEEISTTAYSDSDEVPPPQPRPNVLTESDSLKNAIDSTEILDEEKSVSTHTDEESVDVDNLPEHSNNIMSPTLTINEQTSFANTDSVSSPVTVRAADFDKRQDSSEDISSRTETPVPKARKSASANGSSVDEVEVSKRQRLEETKPQSDESKDVVGELNSAVEPPPVLRRPKSAPKNRAIASKYRSGFVMDDALSMDEMEAQIENEMMSNAATKIQAGFRGYKTRKSIRHSGVRTGGSPTGSGAKSGDEAIAESMAESETMSASASAFEQPQQERAASVDGSAPSASARGSRPPYGFLRSRSYPGPHEDQAESDEPVVELDYDPAYVNNAATKIQASVRGYLVRRSFKDKKGPATVRIASTKGDESPEMDKLDLIIINPADRDNVSPMSEDLESEHAASKIQAAFRGYSDRKKVRQTKKAVVTIQATVRGFLTRRRLAKLRRYINTPTKRKSMQRRRSSAKMVSHEVQRVVNANEAQAATKIQAVYRGYQVRSKIRKNINDE